MPKLAILHYLPLEYYPPITNLIDYLNKRSIDQKIIRSIVYSTHNVKGRKAYRLSDQEIIRSIDNKNKSSIGTSNDLKAKRSNDPLTNKSNNLISLFRSPFPKETDNSLMRLLKYLHYNLFTLFSLLIYRPNDLLYYESYSAWPAYIYTKYFNRKCNIYIHFHEYASKQWYRTTMKQVRYFHQLEKNWLFPRAKWISQTNTDRLDFFHQDHPYLKNVQLRVMPNYPPKSWLTSIGSPSGVGASQPHFDELNAQCSKIKHQTSNILRLVYVGSLSFQSTYLKELCEWVLSQNGKVLFDVYAYNLYDDVKAYLKDLDSPFINYYEKGVEYNEQPQLLAQYDVGLILYKAHNQNYTYNAPNKLFEYLACDLDVWYPDVLQGPKPYDTNNTYPKVVPVDFEKLDQFDWQKAIDKEDLEFKASEYFCEVVYKELVDEIIGQ